MGLNLSAENIAALEARTEGWIAGLLLAAISMQGNPDAASFIQSFTGSHHFVLDYLLEEVLRRQSESVQAFLLGTSILNRLCGPLCEAVLCSPSASGQATLEALERANLFIIPLDNERRWYRYHHLFGDLLRQRLGQSLPPEDIAEYHLRASLWHEKNGDEAEAFHHAFTAGDFERAAGLAESAWQGMDERFQTAAWLGMGKETTRRCDPYPAGAQHPDGPGVHGCRRTGGQRVPTAGCRTVSEWFITMRSLWRMKRNSSPCRR